jgi:uncharacterized protein
MKRISALFLTVLLAALLCLPAFAADGSLGYVTDEVGLLDESAAQELEEKAKSVSEKYSCGVYIITVDDYANFSDAGDVKEAAKDIYRTNELGCGGDKSGVLLLLSMNRRDYALIAYGYGNTAFTDYGRGKVEDAFLDNFSDDDWQGGFDDYLAECAELLDTARAGKPLDAGGSGTAKVLGTLISFGLSALIALIVCAILKGKMKSVAAGREAEDYLVPGSVNITGREDLFLNVTETRVKIQKNSSSSGGGTTVGSDGFSGSSGKF